MVWRISSLGRNSKKSSKEMSEMLLILGRIKAEFGEFFAEIFHAILYSYVGWEEL